MKLVPVCAALLIFFFLGVNAAEFKKGERAQNHPFDCMLPDGSYKGPAMANVNKEWHGSFEDAKKKCAQSPQCKMLHDYNADNGSWRVCRAVKYDPQGKAVTFTKILGVADMDQCQGVDIRKDGSCIKLGEKSDVGIYRTGAKELTIDAKNGVNINSDNLKIGGKTLQEIIDAAVKAALESAKPPLKESDKWDHQWNFDSGNAENSKNLDGPFKLAEYKFTPKAPTFVQKVARFNGVDQCISVEDKDGKFESNKFTLSFRFKTQDPSKTQGIVAHGESFKTDIAYWVLRIQGTKLQLWVEASNDADATIDTEMISTNKWYHVIFVRQTAKHFQLYVDGKLYENRNIYGSHAAAYKEHHPLSIGCRTNSGNRYQDYFKGDIDHVQFYKNKALKPSDFK